MSVPLSQVASIPTLFWVEGWTLVISVILCCIIETLGLVMRLVAARTPAKEKELKRMEEALTLQVKMTNFSEMFVKNSKFKSTKAVIITTRRELLKVEKALEENVSIRTASMERIKRLMFRVKPAINISEKIIVYSLILAYYWGVACIELSYDFTWPSNRLFAGPFQGHVKGTVSVLGLMFMFYLGFASICN